MTDEKKKRILVVDDDSDVRVMLYDLLTSEGYDVLTFEKPLEALSRTAEYAPDIVLLDLRMPEISGLDLLPMLKQAAPDAGIIIVSAYANWDFYVQARERGAHEMVTKPFCSKVILDMIRKVEARRNAAA